MSVVADDDDIPCDEAGLAPPGDDMSYGKSVARRGLGMKLVLDILDIDGIPLPAAAELLPPAAPCLSLIHISEPTRPY